LSKEEIERMVNEAKKLAGAGVPSLFIGPLVYSTIIALLSSAAFGSLVYTLMVI
jgi:hypothetical protein